MAVNGPVVPSGVTGAPTRRVTVGRRLGTAIGREALQRRDQRIVALRDRPGEQLDVFAAARRSRRGRRASMDSRIDREADRLADARMPREPVEARLGAARQVLVMREEVLEQLEPRRRVDGRDRLRASLFAPEPNSFE